MNFSIQDPGLRFPNARTRRARMTGIVVHHLHAHWDVHRTHAHHLSMGWNGIGYNFHVALDGTISSGRGMEFVGSHTNPPAGTNSGTVGVGCEGRYHDVDRAMPDAQFNALVWLIRHLRGIYGNVPIQGHGELAATACPGQFFPLDEVRHLEFRGAPVEHIKIKKLEEEEMTQERFNEMFRQAMTTYTAERRGLPASDWAAEMWARLTTQGITDGTAPQGLMTRQEGLALAARLVEAAGLDPSCLAGCLDGENVCPCNPQE